MMWAARILLVGILAVAAISLIATAIVFAAPYLAALIVVLAVGAIIYRLLGTDSAPNRP